VVVVMPVVVPPVVMMPMVPVVVAPVVMVPMMPVAMMPVVVVMPADLLRLQAIDLILTDHGGLCAVCARRHQGLFR
jgi:hypothetical protein